MCWFVIDASMIFVNLNVKKMNFSIWKMIYCNNDVLIKGTQEFMYKFHISFFYLKEGAINISYV